MLLAIAWLIPFLVHVLPWGGTRPLGAYLLPMFWMAFVAVYLHGLRLGLLVGLFSPMLNLLITGLPALGWLSMMGLELIVFIFFVWWTIRRTPRFWLIAPFGYLVAKILSTLGLALMGKYVDFGTSSSIIIESLRNGLPGLGVLAVINLAMVLLYPKFSEGKRHDASGF